MKALFVSIGFLVLCLIIAATTMRFGSAKQARQIRLEPLVEQFTRTPTKLNARLIRTLSGAVINHALGADSVELISSGGKVLATAFVDSDNRFRMQFPAVDANTIHIVARSHGQWISSARVADLNTSGRVVIGDKPVVTFHMLLKDGLTNRPSNAEIRVKVDVGQGVWVPYLKGRDVSPNQLGEVAIKNLPKDCFINVDSPNKQYGHFRSLQRVAVRSAPDRYFPPIRVHPANTIAGRVVNSQGQGVKKVRVQLLNVMDYYHVETLDTRQDGTFTFVKLPLGVYNVRLLPRVSDGKALTAVPKMRVKVQHGEDVTITSLQQVEGAEVIGTVLHREGNRSLRDCRMVVEGKTSDNQTWWLDGLSGSNGVVKVVVPPGQLTVTGMFAATEVFFSTRRRVLSFPQQVTVNRGQKARVNLTYTIESLK